MFITYLFVRLRVLLLNTLSQSTSVVWSVLFQIPSNLCLIPFKNESQTAVFKDPVRTAL